MLSAVWPALSKYAAAAQVAELLAMVPASAAVFALRPFRSVAYQPWLGVGLALLGALSMVGFSLFLTASRLLSLGLFGVLGYAEPILLVLVSLAFLGEPWRWSTP